MSRSKMIADLSEKIEHLASMHIVYRLENTDHFTQQKIEISHTIKENQVQVQKELDPLTRHLYNRYFD